VNTTRKAGALRPDDLIEVEHHQHAEGQHEDGTHCCGGWAVGGAVVDETDKARVACDGIAVVGWHDADHPSVSGVMVVGAHTKIPYRGHLQAAA
jgi:hypothetical protein